MNNSIPFIDLDLPSGIKWAKYNIVAPNENQLYFQWGDTKGYTEKDIKRGLKNYDWDSYKYGNQHNLTKYFAESYYNKSFVNSNITSLEPKDDIVKSLLGEKWSLPSKEDFIELFDNCDVFIILNNGSKGTLDRPFIIDSISGWTNSNEFNYFKNRVTGIEFISKVNKNKLFFPACGYGNLKQIYNKNIFGGYWCSSINIERSISSYALWFSYYAITITPIERCQGLNIRGIFKD